MQVVSGRGLLGHRLGAGVAFDTWFTSEVITVEHQERWCGFGRLFTAILFIIALSDWKVEILRLLQAAFYDGLIGWRHSRLLASPAMLALASHTKQASDLVLDWVDDRSTDIVVPITSSRRIIGVSALWLELLLRLLLLDALVSNPLLIQLDEVARGWLLTATHNSRWISWLACESHLLIGRSCLVKLSDLRTELLLIFLCGSRDGTSDLLHGLLLLLQSWFRC